jgi:beta-lactamase superfamily II metal-dependent hydrolase
LLLLADSGFAQLNTPEWITFLNPQLVVLSVAAGDINGLPNKETLEAASGLPLLRTDVNGWIEVTSDGHSLWVEVERAAPTLDLTATVMEPAPTEAPAEIPALTEPPVTEMPVVP